MVKKPTYHIIGGGIAGLACAWYIKKTEKDINTIIYEASDKLGGRAYSYHDLVLNHSFDNATHVIVGANKFLSQFITKDEWCTTKYFVDPFDEKLDSSLVKNFDFLLKSFCNTQSSKIAKKIKQYIIKSFFPFISKKTRVWFSRGDISQRFVNVMAACADEINLNCRLNKISSQFGVAAMLEFTNKVVDIGAKDKIIIALDNASCSKILNFKLLEHNQILNIIYHTSETIFLPKGSSFIGLKSGLVDWIFVGNKTLSAVISDYKGSKKDFSDMAFQIWKDIDKVRGVNSAFIPPYKVVCYPQATISQSEEVNALRPNNALTEYPNVFIAGDWTMKDKPCCMETAVLSAIRAVKTAVKSN